MGSYESLTEGGASEPGGGWGGWCVGVIEKEGGVLIVYCE